MDPAQPDNLAKAEEKVEEKVKDVAKGTEEAVQETKEVVKETTEATRAPVEQAKPENVAKTAEKAEQKFEEKVEDIAQETKEAVRETKEAVQAKTEAVETSTVEPATVKPTTVESTTVEKTTVEPTTEESTTEKPTTVQPTTVEPTSVEPAVEKVQSENLAQTEEKVAVKAEEVEEQAEKVVQPQEVVDSVDILADHVPEESVRPDYLTKSENLTKTDKIEREFEVAQETTEYAPERTDASEVGAEPTEPVKEPSEPAEPVKETIEPVERAIQVSKPVEQSQPVKPLVKPEEKEIIKPFSKVDEARKKPPVPPVPPAKVDVEKAESVEPPQPPEAEAKAEGGGEEFWTTKNKLITVGVIMGVILLFTIIIIAVTGSSKKEHTAESAVTKSTTVVKGTSKNAGLEMLIADGITRVCTGNNLPMKCPPNLNITISSVRFVPSGFCGERSKISDPDCTPNYLQKKIQRECKYNLSPEKKAFAMESCNFSARAGNLCNMTGQILEVNYTCQKPTRIVKISLVREDETAKLKCPNGTNVFIHHASFGMEEKETTCPPNAAEVEGGGRNNFTFCAKIIITNKLRDECHGNSTCDILAHRNRITEHRMMQNCIDQCTYDDECFKKQPKCPGNNSLRFCYRNCEKPNNSCGKKCRPNFQYIQYECRAGDAASNCSNCPPKSNTVK